MSVEIGVCETCDTICKPEITCQECSKVCYCSGKCQKLHEKRHKIACDIMVRGHVDSKSIITEIIIGYPDFYELVKKIDKNMKMIVIDYFVETSKSKIYSSDILPDITQEILEKYRSSVDKYLIETNIIYTKSYDLKTRMTVDIIPKDAGSS